MKQINPDKHLDFSQNMNEVLYNTLEVQIWYY